VYGDAGEQRGPPADGVRDRPDQQLPEREAEQGAGEGQLHRGGRGLQVGGDGRQRGQVHVDGQRPECGEESEYEHEPQPAAGREKLAVGQECGAR
jgi:hypothetical protein